MSAQARLMLGMFLLVFVGVLVSYGMLKAGVPAWLRMVVTWCMGWTSGKYIFDWVRSEDHER